MAVVYQHVRNDTNTVFYIGIGEKEKRAYSKQSRNPYWRNIVKKAGYYVEIIYSDLTWDLASNMEQYLIKQYGRCDLGLGDLVNLTNGGDGIVGLIHSEETKRKMSEKRISRPGPNTGHVHSEESKRKMSEKRIGTSWGNHSEETRKKMSEKAIGRTHSEASKKKMSEKRIGRPHSEEHRKKISERQKKKVIDTSTNIIYNSIEEAAKIIGMKYSTLKGMINGNSKNKTNLKFY